MMNSPTIATNDSPNAMAEEYFSCLDRIDKCTLDAEVFFSNIVSSLKFDWTQDLVSKLEQKVKYEQNDNKQDPKGSIYFHILGTIYYHGSGVPKDYLKSKKFFEKSVLARSVRWLGYFYENGFGV